MNKARLIDIAQCAGLCLVAAGVWLQFGGGWSAMVTGSLLVALPIVEIQLTRRGG